MNRLLGYLILLAAGTVCIVVLSCANANSNATGDASAADFEQKILKTRQAPGSVEAADFNKDGFTDIVLANTTDSSLSVFLNDGKGNLREAPGSPFFANRNPNDIAIVDFNKDGNLDLCIANTEVSLLTILFGNGKGQFRQIQPSPFSVHSRPHTHGIAAADFNGDGHIDLATDDWGENKIIIIFGDGQGHFGNETFYGVGNRPYQRLRSADINQDGRPDIVTTNLEGNNTTVLLCDGNGKFHEPAGSPFSCGNAPFGVAIGDLNGDGHPDLAIADAPTITSESKGKDGLWILWGDATGHFSTCKGSPFTTGKSPSRVAIGDVNGDGVSDVVTTNYNDASISIFYMDRSGVKNSKTIAAGKFPDGICIADLNGDHKNDIIVTSQAGNNAYILFQK